MTRRPVWVWVGVGVVVCLSGCSVQMAYNNLDRLARWSVSDYVDMTPDQRNYFDVRFEMLWGWHRREHLPEYAAFLEDFSATLGEPTRDSQMQALVERVVAWAEDVEARAMPVAAELLASLSDEQVAELGQAMEARNVEMAEPEMEASEVEVRALWRREFQERFTRFSGRLNAVQAAYLDNVSTRYRPERVLWADYRRRWQRDFLALLAHRQDVDGLEAGLRQLSRHRELYYGAELSAIDQHNVQLVRDASVWLINSLTEPQRARFAERLVELADDFRELAAQPVRVAGTAPPPCLVRC